MDQGKLSQAMVAYGKALAVADPVRLQFWDKRGLTMTQLRLMYLLLLRGQQTPSELADHMHVRRPTITGLTDRLARQKLIKRLNDRGDRRMVRVALTDNGREVLGEIEVASRAYLSAVLQRMGENGVDELIRVFEQFGAAAEVLQTESEFRP